MLNEKCETVIVKNNEGGALIINKSDYDSEIHGESWQTLDDFHGGNSQPSLNLTPVGGGSGTQEAPQAVAVNTQETSQPVAEFYAEKLGAKWFVMDANRNPVADANSGFELSGYKTEAAANEAIAAKTAK